MSVSGFGLSVSLYLQVLVRSLYRRFFFEISQCPSNLQSCVPPGGVIALFPQDLTGDLCIPFVLG